MEKKEICSIKLEISRNIYAKMGTIKDRNGMDLTEAYEIKKIQTNSTKKGLNNPNNHDGVVTIDILGCKVKSA